MLRYQEDCRLMLSHPLFLTLFPLQVFSSFNFIQKYNSKYDLSTGIHISGYV